MQAQKKKKVYNCKQINIIRARRPGDNCGPLKEEEMKEIMAGLPESSKSEDLFDLFTKNIKRIHNEIEKRQIIKKQSNSAKSTKLADTCTKNDQSQKKFSSVFVEPRNDADLVMNNT